MTLHELQRALVNAGADRRTCEQCAEAMTLHNHCGGHKAQLTSTQAARMLWLVLICQDTAVVRTESLLLMESHLMPRERGQRDAGTVLQFLSAVIRNTSLATAVESLEVDAGTRLVTVQMRDDDPLEFTAPDATAYPSAPIGSVTVTGSFLCRIATAYSSSVWLPIYSESIRKNDQLQQEEGTRDRAAV